MKKFAHIPLPITTDNLVLKLLEPNQAHMLCQAHQETYEQLKQWTWWAQEQTTPEATELVIRHFWCEYYKQTGLHLGVFKKDTGEFVGMCGFRNIDWSIPKLEIGYWCKKSAQGNGYITQAANALTRYAFEQLGVRRLSLICDKENIKSSAIAQRLKFDLECESKGFLSKPGTNSLRTALIYVRFNTDNLPPCNAHWEK